MSEGFWHQFFFGGFCGLNFPLRRNRFLPTSNVLKQLEQTELINVSLPSRVWIQVYLRIFLAYKVLFGNLENDLENVDSLCKRLDFVEKKQPCFEPFFWTSPENGLNK